MLEHPAAFTARARLPYFNVLIICEINHWPPPIPSEKILLDNNYAAPWDVKSQFLRGGAKERSAWGVLVIPKLTQSWRKLLFGCCCDLQEFLVFFLSMKAKVKFHYSRQCYSASPININATFPSKSMFSQQDTSFRAERSLRETKNCKVTDDNLAHLNHWKSPVKKIIQIYLRRIEKERNRATWLYPSTIKKKEIYFIPQLLATIHTAHIPLGFCLQQAEGRPGSSPGAASNNRNGLSF